MSTRLNRKARPARRHTEEFIDSVSLGLCQRTGKKRWTTRAGARQHLRYLKTGDTSGRRLGTYRCKDGCGDWHVGHRGRAA